MSQSNTKKETITLEPGVVSLAQLRDIYINHCSFDLYEQAWEDIDTSAIAVQKIVDKGDAAYGASKVEAKINGLSVTALASICRVRPLLLSISKQAPITCG